MLDSTDSQTSDLRWLGVQNSSLFNSSFLAENYEELPDYDGTEIPEGSPDLIEKFDPESAALKRLQELFTSHKKSATTIEDFESLNASYTLEHSQLGKQSKMRARLLQRIHLALLREEHRGQKSDPQLESFLHEDAELTVEDADAILTASSVRMSLVIMRSLRGSNPELFRAVCETLIDLLQKSSKLALSHVKANSPQAETLNSITQFAREVVTTATGAERSEALALMFAVAISKGSVHDVVDVVNHLAAGDETLAASASKFKDLLAAHSTSLKMKIPDPHGIISSVTAKIGGATADGTMENVASSVATDGTYLYLWNGVSRSLHKVGTGFNGTIAGNEYNSNTEVFAQLREHLGDEVVDDDENDEDGDAPDSTPAANVDHSVARVVMHSEEPFYESIEAVFEDRNYGMTAVGGVYEVLETVEDVECPDGESFMDLVRTSEGWIVHRIHRQDYPHSHSGSGSDSGSDSDSEHDQVFGDLLAPGEIDDGNDHFTAAANEKGGARKPVIAWLAYVEGKLYMRVQPLVGPFKVAVFHPQTLRLDTVKDIHLPLPAFLKRASEQNERKDEETLAESKVAEDGATATAEEDDEDAEWVDGEIVNFATSEQGASVIAASTNFRASGHDVERIILQDPASRDDSDAAFQFHDDDQSQELVLDLGAPRRITQIGAGYNPAHEEHGVHAHLHVQVSANGNEYVDWNTQSTDLEASAMLPRTAEYTGSEEIRFIRFNFGPSHPSGGSRVNYLCAMGPERIRKKAEIPFPVMITEGRHLLFAHAGKTAMNEQGECEHQMEVFIIDPLQEMHCVYHSTFNWGCPEETLHLSTLATNGEKLMMLTTKHGRAKDSKHVSLTARMFDVRSGKITDERDVTYSVASGVPTLLTYDSVNNMIWGFDLQTLKLPRWRNEGLAPIFAPPRPEDAQALLSSASPAYRLEALANSSLEGGSPAIHEAATIMCQLDRTSEIFAPPALPRAEAKSADEIEVVSAGMEDGNFCRISVRGQCVGTHDRGFNIVHLDDQYRVVEEASFDTHGSSGESDRMADFIEKIPRGRLVLVAVMDEANSNLVSRARGSLRKIGADKMERLGYRGSFALIGRKGAEPGSVPQHMLDKGNGVASVTQRLPSQTIPLCVDVSPATFEHLAGIVTRYHPLLAQAGHHYEKVILLSAFRMLTTNVSHLLRGTPLKRAVEIFPESLRRPVLDIILPLIDAPPSDELGLAVTGAAVRLLTSSIDLWYPSPEARCALLVQYLNEYVEDKLSTFERSVLELLLRQLSDASALSALLRGSDGQAVSPSALMQSLLSISKKELVSKLDAISITGSSSILSDRGASQVGEAAVQMLSSLCNQVVSKASQNVITTSVTPDGSLADSSGLETLTVLIDEMCSTTAVLLQKAIAASDALHPDETTAHLADEIDELLKMSPANVFLPTLMSVVSTLVAQQRGKLVTALGIPTTSLIECLKACKQAIVRLPKSKLVAAPAVPEGPKYENHVFESLHPYMSNTNETIELLFPGAVRMTITFDEQTRTEQNYDYVRIWRNRERTESWHPEIDKLTGRHGSENWPGFGGRPPLVIEADAAFVEWYSDGSNEDWGWRMNVKVEYKPKPSTASQHWLLQLEQQLAGCGGNIASMLVSSIPWNSAKEDLSAVWLEDDLFARGSTVAALTVEDEFLHDLIDRPEGSHARTLCEIMRKKVIEDQGHVDSINRAVYATCAALIRQNGLTMDALAVAKGTRDDIPDKLIKAWKAGQKMRQFFDYGDARGAAESSVNDDLPPTAPSLMRGPSIFSGADASVVDDTAAGIIARAKFLLQLPPPATKDTAAKKRWNLIAKLTKSKSQETSSKSFAALVTEVAAASKLKDMLSYRRKAAEKSKSNQAATVTERILRFVQSSTDVVELQSLRQLRDARAEKRTAGIRLATELLQAIQSPASIMWVFACVADALNSTRIPGRTSAPAHFMNAVEGCTPTVRDKLIAEFTRWLGLCVKTVTSSADKVHNVHGKDAQAERAAWKAAVLVGLQAVALDYNVTDYGVLSESRLVATLGALLHDEDADVRRMTWTIFEVLLPRCIGMEGQKLTLDPEEHSELMRELVAFLVHEFDRASDDVARLADLMSTRVPMDESLPTSVALVPSIAQLRRDQLGPVARNIPVGLSNSIAMWVKRPVWPSDIKPLEMEVGARVRRGPHWQPYADEDGGDGKLGTVSAVKGTTVSVRWDTGVRRDYRWGTEEDGEPRFDVLLADEGQGGNLIMKGASNMLTDEERDSVWSSFGLDMRDNATIRFFAVSGEDKLFSLNGEMSIPPNVWTHVAYVQDVSKCRIYINGVLDVEGVLDGHMLNPGKSSTTADVVETPHPYRDNMDEYWTVEIEGAESYTITFDPRSRTERNYDFVRIYKDNSHQDYWGEEKYTGGMNGSDANWPGVGGRPPLKIPASRFIVHFHSDGSNNDWGFKLTAVASIPVSADEIEEPTIEVLNNLPIYIGQPPSYVSNARTAEVFVGGVHMFSSALPFDKIRKMLDNPFHGKVAEIAPVNDTVALDMLAMLQKCTTSMIQHGGSGAKPLAGPHVLQPLLQLVAKAPLRIRLAALEYCRILLPEIPVELVDTQAVMLGLASNDSGFVGYLLQQAGRILCASTLNSTEAQALPGSEDSYALALRQIGLLQALFGSEEWAKPVCAAVRKSCAAIPAVIDALTAKAKEEIAVGLSDPASFMNLVNTMTDDLAAAFGLAALLGGSFDGVFAGAFARCRTGPKDSPVLEDCTVIAATVPPVLEEKAPDEEKLKWKDCHAFGDALVVVLHSQPDKCITVPRSQLVSASRPIPDSVSQGLAADEAALLEVVRRIATIDCTDTRPQYMPIVEEFDKEEVVESKHPYDDNADVYYPLEFPGAEEVVIEFDPQTRTEDVHDYVRFYKDDNHTDYWGESKYAGRDRSQNWPGLLGLPPLKIPAERFVVYFHSDGSNNDWGFKLTAKARCVKRTVPPDRPPLLSLSLLAQLKHSGLRAASSLISHCSWMVAAAAPMSKLFLDAALAQHTQSGSVRPAPKPVVLESSHPYDHNADDYHTVEVRGAKKLIVTFDPQTCSEAGCDYMRIYKDDSHTEYWGENQYTGGKDGGNCNWPSIKGRPPLEIPSDRFVVYWHTDGSVNCWGWKMIVTPVMGVDGATNLGTAEINDRVYTFLNYLNDGPQLLEEPEGLHRFPLQPFTPKPLVQSGDISMLDFEEEAPVVKPASQDRLFVVNTVDTDHVRIHSEQKEDSSTLISIREGQVIEAISEDGDWLQVKYSPEIGFPVTGWVKRREGDRLFVVPKDIGNLITLEPDEEQEEREGPKRHPMYECDNNAGDESVAAVSASPTEILSGNIHRVTKVVTELSELGAIKAAQDCVTGIITRWPQELEFTMAHFGDSAQFLTFLRGLFVSEQDKSSSPTLEATRAKLLQLVRNDRQDTSGLCKTLVLYATKQLFDIMKLETALPPTKATMQTIETKHNYDDNSDLYWDVRIPGAKRLKLVFDKRSATENECDYVLIYKDSSHNERWGSKYTGRGDMSNKRWPGVSVPPLYIDSDHCCVHFHSDGSNNDWGFKLYIYGIMEEPSKEQLDELELKKTDPNGPNPELACWIFEALAKEDVPVIQHLMYHATTLSVLRRYIESMPESKITWIVTMLTSMLQEIARAPLDSANIRELRLLMSTLLSRASKQFQLEQGRPDSDRSQLLQCLVQAAVVVDTTVRSVLNSAELNVTSPLAKPGVADLESKEEVEQSESKQLEVGMPGFRWTPDACGRGIETMSARKGVRKGPRAGADAYSTALSNIGFTSGKHRFNIVIKKLTGPGPLIGFGHPAINLNASLGTEPGSVSWGGQSLLYNGESKPFGPKFNPGDVITVELDVDNEALFFFRNTVLVGQALGREGTGAVGYMPFGEGPFHPAVSLITPGDEIEIQEVTDDAGSGADTEMPAWFAPVREAVELLRSCARRELPNSIITREFIPACQSKASKVVESIHPYDGTGLTEIVEIPGASQLEIHFDPQTDMAPKDTISIEDESKSVQEFVGQQGGTSAPTRSDGAINVGDRVVRGVSWDWGDQDGGAGGFGDVQAIRAWKGKPNAGVLVQWRDSDFTGLYRWDYDGCFDVKVVGRAEKALRPIVVDGNKVTIDIIPGPTPIVRQESRGVSWRGCALFEGDNHGVEIPHRPTLELQDSFTVEAWVKPAETAAAVLPIVTRRIDLGDIVFSPFSLQLGYPGECGTSTLVFHMDNADMSRGVLLSGGTVNRLTWTHVAATKEGSMVRLLVNGVEVAQSEFTGIPLESMQSPLHIGCSSDGSRFHGHIHDVRVWTNARATEQIVAGKGLLPPRDAESLAVSLPLDDAEHKLMERVSPEESEAISGECGWDPNVEPPNQPPGSTWGYKITVVPKFTMDSVTTSERFRGDFEYLQAQYTLGELKHDLALVRYVNDVANRKNMDANQLLRCAWTDIAPSADELVARPTLRELIELDIGHSDADGKSDQPQATEIHPAEARFKLLQLLNRTLAQTIAFVDLCMVDKPWSIARLLSGCRGLIFRCIKLPIWQNALDATTSGGGEFELRLSRPRASRFAQRGEVDHEGRHTVFSQAFRQMHTMPPSNLRRSNKMYRCTLMGERAHDAGGPYRESWSMYSADLQSPSLPLLIRTPNARHNAGQGREKWTLNPGSTSSTHEQMYIFLGKLMGMAIRTEEYLALNLPSMVWKLLVNDTVNREDLEGVDAMLCQSMDKLRNIHLEGITEDLFEDVFMETFTTLSTDDRVIELVADGANKPVTFANRYEYATLVEQYRMREIDQHVAWVRQGLATIIPQRLLSLFTWDELETMVCGKPDIDVELLRSTTEYSGCRHDDQHVQYFWQALREFTPEERSMLIRFTWGRSRLPLNAASFPQRFKLQNYNRHPADNYLPISHTCFFSLELPAYSSLEVMKEKLRYAIYNCTAIDGDDTSLGMQAAALGWED